jgi:hypothetical protein
MVNMESVSKIAVEDKANKAYKNVNKKDTQA